MTLSASKALVTNSVSLRVPQGHSVSLRVTRVTQVPSGPLRITQGHEGHSGSQRSNLVSGFRNNKQPHISRDGARRKARKRVDYEQER